MTAIDADHQVLQPPYLKEKRIHHATALEGTPEYKSKSIRRRSRIYPEGGSGMIPRKSGSSNGKGTKTNNEESRNSRRRRSSKKQSLKVDTQTNNGEAPSTPLTVASTPDAPTPAGKRGSKDLRSPGITKTPSGSKVAAPDNPIPDFITQTDRFGNAATPRSKDAIDNARVQHPSGPKPALHVDANGQLSEDPAKDSDNDPCETLLDSIRLMCCCLLPEDNNPCTANKAEQPKEQQPDQILEEPQDKTERVRLLPKHHPDDVGKKCLVLDLDETLVHSSFRAVPGADFVIPVQIEDVVHFVYVAKRPGVDEFLIEMAKHYEIVIYTASLNKYADPLLDLLDPHRTIRCRLFRESCVYYEGNYVKDLSLLDRDLCQSIIVDNSPSSYIFHPENAIDCSSFIDDPQDRELDQIAAFLKGVKDVKDVRNLSNLWREWPNVDIEQFEQANHR